MIRLFLFAVLAFFVIQVVRTTMRIKGNAKQWKEEDDAEHEKPPVLNIPDIQDAKFEDITKPDEQPEKPPDNPPHDIPPSS